MSVTRLRLERVDPTTTQAVGPGGDRVPFDSVPSKVTAAVLRQFLSTPDKRALLPKGHVAEAGQRLAASLQGLIPERGTLVIESSDPALLAIPWELVGGPDAPLAVHDGLQIRRELGAPSMTLSGTVRVLLHGGTALEEPLLRAAKAGGLELDLEGTLRPADVWVLDAPGHIQEGGQHLVLDDLLHTPDVLLEAGRPSVVILPRCPTSPLPEIDGPTPTSAAQALIQAGVPAVIGLQAPLGDDATALWLESVLRGLAEHGDPARAVADARAALAELGDWSWALPVVWLGDGTASDDAKPALPPDAHELPAARWLTDALNDGARLVACDRPATLHRLRELEGWRVVSPRPDGALVERVASAVGVGRTTGPGAKAAFETALRAAFQDQRTLVLLDALHSQLTTLLQLGAVVAVAGPLDPEDELLARRCPLPIDPRRQPPLPAWESPEAQLEAASETVRQHLAHMGPLTLPAWAWEALGVPATELWREGWLQARAQGLRAAVRPDAQVGLDLGPEDRVIHALDRGDTVAALAAVATAMEVHLSQGSPRAALCLAQDVLRTLDPETPMDPAVPVLLAASRGHAALSESEHARAALENAAAWSEDPAIHLALAQLKMEQGDTDDAVTELNALVVDHMGQPVAGHALVELALFDEAQGQVGAAVGRLGHAQTLVPPHEQDVLLGHLGRMLLAVDRPEQAKAVLAQRVERFESAAALAGLASAERALGNVEAARALQERRLLDPDPVEQAGALLDLAQLDLAADDSAAAMTRLEQAWTLVTERNRLDGIAGVGSVFGQLLSTRDPERSAQVLGRAQRAFQSMGQAEQAEQIGAMVDAVAQGSVAAGDPSDALLAARDRGDGQAIAHLQFQLAQTDLKNNDLDAAAPRLAEAWTHAVRDDAKAAIGFLHAQLLARAEQRGDALAVAREAHDAAGRVGHAQQMQHTQELVNRLEQDPQALLAEARATGDRARVAALQYQLAQQDLKRQDQASAVKRLSECWRINELMGDPRGMAASGALYGQLLSMEGRADEARTIYERALQAAQSLAEPMMIAHLRTLLRTL